MTIFDRAAVRRHRDRALAGFAAHDFLFREVAERLADRLSDVTHRFPVALDLGCRTGAFAEVLQSRGGIRTLIRADVCPAMAARAGQPALAADDEHLPFAAESLDLVVSVLGLHWTNDLPGALLQIREALKPDGLFLAALFGGDTLRELRQALMQAEIEIEGGASPRLSPFVDIRDAGALLQRAGFALPVVDSDLITVSYPDALALMRDLRGMAETNALVARRKNFSRRTTLLRAAAIYAERFGADDGRIPASFQVITLTGWKPHARQQQPLKPGRAAARLAEALGGPEMPVTRKPDPD